MDNCILVHLFVRCLLMHCINATSPRHISVKKLIAWFFQALNIKITKAGKYPTFHFSLINLYLTAFYSLKKGFTPNIRMLCFVMINSVFILNKKNKKKNFLCVWILLILMSLAHKQPCIICRILGSDVRLQSVPNLPELQSPVLWFNLQRFWHASLRRTVQTDHCHERRNVRP